MNYIIKISRKNIYTNFTVYSLMSLLFCCFFIYKFAFYSVFVLKTVKKTTKVLSSLSLSRQQGNTRKLKASADWLFPELGKAQ